MITHLHAATIVVTNQDKALDFYIGILGWEKTNDSPMGPDMRWITIRPKGAVTNVALAMPGWFTKKPSLEVGMETGIAFSATDLMAMYAELKKRGVNFKGEPQMQPWGKLGVWFTDPDKNEFFVAEA